jgi:hypothetical protein
MPGELWWGFWSDYPKANLNGREYAQIGERLYTEHAVKRFLPSGRRTIGNVPVAQGEGGGYLFHEKSPRHCSILRGTGHLAWIQGLDH